MKKAKKTTTKNPDITEIKRAEEKAKQAAAEWQTTFDSIADLVSIQSKDFKLVQVNKAYADAVGMKIEDIIGKHCYEVVHNTSSSIVNCPHRQTLETKKAVTQEVFEPRLNAYLEVSTSPIFDSDGELIGSVHIAKNTTERKKAETALRERLKELNCLYGISAILEVPGISLDEILKRIVLVLPPAWRFPDITEACIVLRGQTFQTEHFRKTSWMQFSEIIVHGKTVGQIMVCYLEERQSSAEGPFLAEERRLLDAIAERLGHVIERVWAEEALQQSEERYRSLYVESRDAVMILSPDEGFLAGNPSAIEMFGCRDEQDFTSRTPASLSPEYQTDGALSVDRSREMMRIALEKGSHSFEWVHRRADGTDFNATVLLSRMGSGGKRRLQATVRDITESKRADDALRQSEERFRQMVDLLPEAVCEFDTSGNILFGNRAAFIMVGYDQADFEKELNLLPMIAPEDRERAFTNIQRMLTGEALGADEYTLVRKDGSRFPATVHIANILNASGKTVGFRGIIVDITERKRAEEALVTSEARYRSYIDVTGQIGWVTNANGEVKEDVPSLRKFSGQTYEEAKGSGWTKALHPDDLEHTLQVWNKAVATKSTYEIEYRMRRHDGVYRDLLARGFPVFREDGSIREWVGTCIDITERRQAEDALQESEDRIHLLLDSAAEAIYGIDLNGNCTFCNSACLRMLGYKRTDELLGRNMHWQIHSKRPDGTPFPIEECRIFQAFRNGKGTHVDDEVLWRSDGTSFAVEYWSYPLISNGIVAGAVVTFLDITERKRTQETLRQFVDRLSLATRAGGVGIWDYDIINNKLIWDDQMYHLYGITQDKFGGAYEAWRAGLHPEDMQRGDDEIQMALRGEKEFDTEFRVLWPDGTIRNIRALAILQRDASGKPLRMIGTNWDITERKQAEAELEKTIQELQSAIEQIRTLKGLVPICAWCKKIRNDKGYWEQVEAYVSRYTEAQFSHGICPECAKKAYPEFSKDKKTASK
jgi:PAS domain S-box-containing protein